MSDADVVKGFNSDGSDEVARTQALRIAHALRREFDDHGVLAPEETVANLRRILTAVPPQANLICLLHSELNRDGSIYQRMKRLNDSLRQIAAEQDNFYLVDMDEVVQSQDERHDGDHSRSHDVFPAV